MKRALLILLGLLFVICTFHSCVQVNIGQRIREGGERQLGVDTRQPEGGLVYRLATPEGEDDRWFLRAPELSYRRETPWVTAKGSPLARLLDLPAPFEGAPALDPCPTGRLLLVECRRADSGALIPLTRVDTLPAAARPEPAGKTAREAALNEYHLGNLGQVEAGMARRLAAAPFDYLLDPVLSGAASTADCLFSALFMLYWIPNILITGDAHPPL